LGNRLVQAFGEVLDALGRRIERGDNRGLRRLAMVGRGDARIAQRRQLRLEPLQLFLRLRELVGERERRHDREPGVADLAEAGAQRGDARVQFLRQPRQPRLFAVLAGHAELATVDGDIDLRHDVPRLTLTLLSVRSLRARSGWCRWRHRAAARPRDWWLPAFARGRRRRQAPRRGANGRCQARATGRPAFARRGLLRADARPRPPARRAQAQDVCWPRRWRWARSFSPPGRQYPPDSSALWPRKSFGSASG